MHKLSSSDHPVSPEQDTEVWQKRKKGDVQSQVLPLGLELPSLLQPQHREPQGGFHAAGNHETKGCSSGTSSPLQSLDRAEVILSNKLENIKKNSNVGFKTGFF